MFSRILPKARPFASMISNRFSASTPSSDVSDDPSFSDLERSVGGLESNFGDVLGDWERNGIRNAMDDLGIAGAPIEGVWLQRSIDEEAFGVHGMQQQQTSLEIVRLGVIVPS